MNKNGRGMNLVISLLLIVLLVFWFSGILRSMEDTCTQAEFNQMLDAGEISGAVVVQNREVPTGSVEVHLTSGDEKVLVVSDVNPVLEDIAVRGIEIQMISNLPFFLREKNIEIAILTLPKNKAKDMADILIENGIKAIWNFAHIDLETPEDVIVENVHLSESLMTLSYNLSQYRQEHVEEQQS